MNSKKNIYDIRLDSGISRYLVSAGRLLSAFIPFRNHSAIFFFFPYYHIGGAEKVHAEIVQCFLDIKPWVFFTHRSFDAKFKGMFSEAATLFNVWFLLKYTLPVSVGLVSGFINRHPSAVVFGCNSRFFYKMLPFLNCNVRRIDLMHAFGGGSEFFSFETVPCLDARVVINAKTMSDFEEQYRSEGVSLDYLSRVQVIENKVEVPTALPQKKAGKLKILYVGRGSEEKRVHLIGRVASACKSANIDADFILVGDVESAVDARDRASCTFLGEISNRSIVKGFYSDAHMLLLTSSREGFPMVVMEAMAHGVVPACTSVGGIPVHVHNGVNGFLTSADTEDEIVADLVRIVADIASDSPRLKQISNAAYCYAKDHFDSGNFCSAYRRLITSGT